MEFSFLADAYQFISTPYGTKATLGHAVCILTLFFKLWTKAVALATMIASYQHCKTFFKRELIDWALIISVIKKILSRPLRVWLTSEGMRNLTARPDDEDVLTTKRDPFHAEIEETIALAGIMHDKIADMKANVEYFYAEMLAQHLLEQTSATKGDIETHWRPVILHLDNVLKERGIDVPVSSDAKVLAPRSKGKQRKDVSKDARDLHTRGVTVM